MIQIQDDNSNQGGASQIEPTASDNASNVDNDGSTDSNNNAAASSHDSTAEIDRLLAELDKLAKETEIKSVEPQELAEKPQELVNEPQEQEVSDKPAETNQPATTPEPVDTANSPTEAAATSDKFDFDAFLADLETKIDREKQSNRDTAIVQEQKPIVTAEPVANNQEADKTQIDDKFQEQDEISNDFRKNRPSLDALATDESEKTVDEVTVEDKTDHPTIVDEELKAQNIFEMLGLMKIADTEKNQFLDELETIIWNDFVTHDLELLLTSEEYAAARQILDDASKNDDEKKENLIVYLEKLLPDLDEILYDKALELKSEMMAERLSQMKSKADETVLAKIKEVENLISQNKWKSASLLLNQLS